MIEGLAPELQTHEALKDFNSSEDLAKSFIDIRTKASSGSLEILPADLKDHETIKFYKDIPNALKGLIETKKLVGSMKRPPEKSEEYKFTPVEGLHKNIKSGEGFQKFLADGVHKLGLSTDQADGVHKLSLGYLSTIAQQQEAAAEEAFKKNDAALRQEWPGDKYEVNFNRVVRMLTKAGGEEVAKEAAKLGETLKLQPALLKTYARIANALSEDSINSLDGGSGGGGGSDSDDKEYEELSNALRTNDPKHAINNPKDPNHNKARERWMVVSVEHHKKAAAK